jgi:hypothetical protein
MGGRVYPPHCYQSDASNGIDVVRILSACPVMISSLIRFRAHSTV